MNEKRPEQKPDTADLPPGLSSPLPFLSFPDGRRIVVPVKAPKTGPAFHYAKPSTRPFPVNGRFRYANRSRRHPSFPLLYVPGR